MTKTRSRSALLIFLGVLLSIAAYADGAQHHGPLPENRTEIAGISRINQNYVSQVKPIFQRACLDCHSDQTRFPWYYRIPGVKQFIDHDIAEAREDLEMSHDFPFGGKDGFSEHLNSIAKSIDEGDMPPWTYRMMHPEAKLTDTDKSVIHEWVLKSLDILAHPSSK